MQAVDMRRHEGKDALAVMAAHKFHGGRHEPRIAPVERVRGQRPFGENTRRNAGTQDAFRRFDAKPGAHGDPCKTIAQRIVDAVMGSQMRVKIERAGAATRPHIVNSGTGKLRKDTKQPGVQKLCHGTKVADALSSEAAENDARRIVWSAANVVDVEIPVDVGAIGRERFRHEQWVKLFGGDYIGIKRNDPALEPGDEIAGIAIGGHEHIACFDNAAGSRQPMAAAAAGDGGHGAEASHLNAERLGISQEALVVEARMKSGMILDPHPTLIEVRADFTRLVFPADRGKDLAQMFGAKLELTHHSLIHGWAGGH
jgi:hypothetical protein